jgi:hypothetical protein
MDTDLNPCSSDELIIRERFKADYKLSCPVLDDNDCFLKSLEIWDLADEWKLYLDISKKHSDFDAFRKNIRNNIVQAIQNVPGFNQIYIPSNLTRNHIVYTGPRSYLEKENCNKRLVSIDLIKGNFNALRTLSPKFVLGCATYEDFIRKFTDEDSLINSKYFRQMVFGLVNPELQKKVQEIFLSRIITEIRKYKNFPIVHITSDEVVFPIENDADLINIQEITRNLQIPMQFRIKEFSIRHIPNKYNEPWYIRYDENKKRIMSVHVRYLFQVWNHIHNQPNQKKDLYWRECGRLAVLLEPEVFGPH